MPRRAFVTTSQPSGLSMHVCEDIILFNFFLCLRIRQAFYSVGQVFLGTNRAGADPGFLKRGS